MREEPALTRDRILSYSLTAPVSDKSGDSNRGKSGSSTRGGRYRGSGSNRGSNRGSSGGRERNASAHAKNFKLNMNVIIIFRVM